MVSPNSVPADRRRPYRSAETWTEISAQRLTRSRAVLEEWALRFQLVCMTEGGKVIPADWVVNFVETAWQRRNSSVLHIGGGSDYQTPSSERSTVPRLEMLEIQCLNRSDRTANPQRASKNERAKHSASTWNVMGLLRSAVPKDAPTLASMTD